MSKANLSKQAAVLLEAIESELRRQDVWRPMPPSVEAMASTTPFCVDTMAFSQWLQWIFVPRVRAIIDSGGALPRGSNIKAYAEEALPLEGLEGERLLLIIEKFDLLVVQIGRLSFLPGSYALDSIIRLYLIACRLRERFG